MAPALLAVRSAEAICFYDWESARMLRRIEVAARAISWNDSGELVAITSEDAFFVLKFNRAAADAPDAEVGDEGIEAAFELQHEVSDAVQGGVWVGDCFVYTNAANRLNYYVGGEVITLAHLDRRMYVLGYLQKEGRVFLMDKAGAVTSYGLCLAVLEYQTVVVRRDFAAANRILPEVPREHLNAIAKFLEGQGFKEQALSVAVDPDIKFDLAVQLGKLDMAQAMLKGAAAAAAGAGATDGDAAELTVKWKQLLDLALATSDLGLAEECAENAGDLGALLLIYSSVGDRAGLLRLGARAEEAGRSNVAYLAFNCAGDVGACTRVLAASGQGFESEVHAAVYRGAEAALRPAVSAGAGAGAASAEPSPARAEAAGAAAAASDAAAVKAAAAAIVDEAVAAAEAPAEPEETEEDAAAALAALDAAIAAAGGGAGAAEPVGDAGDDE